MMGEVIPSALKRARTISLARSAGAALVLAVAVTLLAGWSSAHAETRSKEVALVPDRAGEECCAGALPTKGSVHGVPADSFEEFHFTNLPVSGISSTGLAKFDTVVLNQVYVGHLGASERLALSEFVTKGGKLIIHDADATSGNDYSWLPGSTHTHTLCALCESGISGSSKIARNTTLASKETFSPYYVNTSQIDSMTDASDDANIMVEDGGIWFKDIELVNSVAQKDKAIQAYAASGSGLMLYDGYDTDYMGIPEEPGEVDWLAKLWYQELKQGWNPDSLPRFHENIVYYPSDPYYKFRFLPPVQGLPSLNGARAGVPVPVRFGLGSNEGLDIFATGFPKSQPIACDDPGRVLGPALPAFSPGGWSLRFSRGAGAYTFQWKTHRQWAGGCRRLILTLADGTTHTAKFAFR